MSAGHRLDETGDTILGKQEDRGTNEFIIAYSLSVVMCFQVLSTSIKTRGDDIKDERTVVVFFIICQKIILSVWVIRI